MDTKPTILIIEDDPTFQELYAARFQEAGFEVLQAFDGIQALDLLDTHSEIKVALVDIMLPKISGFEVISQIRDNVLTKNIPVIVVSALSSLSDKEHSEMLGANSFVTKGDMLIADLVEQAKLYADTA